MYTNNTSVSLQDREDSVLDDILPQSGSGSFNDGLKCYSLPYGGLGTISHLLTFYTIVCLMRGRRPLMPWKKLDRSKWDVVISAAGVLGTLGTSAVALMRCRNSTAFALLAAWKLLFSLSYGGIGIHRGVDQYRRGGGATFPKPDTKRFWEQKILWWVFPEAAAIIMGFAALVWIIGREWPERTPALVIICIAFGVLAVLVIVSALFVSYRYKKGVLVGLFAITVTPVILMPLWADWVLAAISISEGGNWWGAPTSDELFLSWGYWIFKRFPMLAW